MNQGSCKCTIIIPVLDLIPYHGEVEEEDGRQRDQEEGSGVMVISGRCGHAAENILYLYIN